MLQIKTRRAYTHRKHHIPTLVSYMIACNWGLHGDCHICIIFQQGWGLPKALWATRVLLAGINLLNGLRLHHWMGEGH